MYPSSLKCLHPKDVMRNKSFPILGTLEDFAMFGDETRQMTRIGSDLSVCYLTRWVEDIDPISGETVLIALTITDYFISMKINGMIY